MLEIAVGCLVGVMLTVVIVGGMAGFLWAISGTRLDKALMGLTGQYLDAVHTKSKRARNAGR